MVKDEFSIATPNRLNETKNSVLPIPSSPVSLCFSQFHSLSLSLSFSLSFALSLSSQRLTCSDFVDNPPMYSFSANEGIRIAIKTNGVDHLGYDRQQS